MRKCAASKNLEACAFVRRSEDPTMSRRTKRIDRRDLLKLGATALGAAALGPARLFAAESDEEQKLYAAAKKEGKVVWWTSHYQLSAAEGVRDAFKAKYPGIDVEFIRQTAQVIFQRLSQNLKAGVKEVDVFASTDESHYLKLKRQNVLAQYTPLGLSHLPTAYRDVDPDHTYQTGAIALILINYNTSVKAPPQKWTELLDTKWQDQITLGHPGFSGFVGNWVVAMWDKYGWDYFTKLAKNKPKIGRSIFDTVTDIVGGERKVGAGPDNQSLESKSKGNPIDIKLPADDSILCVSPVAIMKDAPHPNAGRLFESFFYTKEYSQALTKTFNYPLRSDVPAPSGIPIEKVKYYRNKADRLDKGIPEAIEKWRETFGV
jgi:iron(III) transport system substrate-binding protein